MPDVFDRAQRAALMRRIKGRNTGPERVVGSALRRMGFRPRHYVKILPGSPDIVIDTAMTAIFVHGCFWHRHSCPRGQSRPTTRAGFWRAKFADNVRRDRRVSRALRRSGWSVVVVWECQTRDVALERTERRLRRFLARRLKCHKAPA